MIDALTSLFATYGLAGLFIALALGQLGLPLPTSILLMTAGALLREGSPSPAATLAWALGGAVAGDQGGYLVGRIAGTRLEEAASSRPWISAGLARSSSFSRKWGGLSVFLSRWLVSPLGPWVNLASGATGYSWPVFTFWGVLGEAVWIGAYTSLGYAFSASITGLAEVIANAGWAIAGLTVTLVAGWQLWRRARPVRTGRPDNSIRHRP